MQKGTLAARKLLNASKPSGKFAKTSNGQEYSGDESESELKQKVLVLRRDVTGLVKENHKLLQQLDNKSSEVKDTKRKVNYIIE